MSLRNLSRATSLLVALVVSAAASAEQRPVAKSTVPPPRAASPAQVVNRKDFGPTDLTLVRLEGAEFYPYQGPAFQGYQSFFNYRWSTPAGFALEAGIRVPTGAIIDYIEIDACDGNALLDMSLTLYECDIFGGPCTTPAFVVTDALTGCGTVSVSGIGHEVNNALFALGLEVFDPAGDSSLRISGAAVGYYLQVSPAPAVATFGDVPTGDIYFQFIEALAASGITAGCDAVPNYCPERPITRAEMAVFLAKALGLHFPN